MSEQNSPESGDHKPSDPKPPPLPGRKAPGGPPRIQRGMIGWMLIIGLGMGLAFILSGQLEDRTEVDIRQFWNYVENDQLDETLFVHPDKIEGTLKESVKLKEDESPKFYVTFDYRNHENFDTYLRGKLDDAKSRVKVEYPPVGWFSGIFPHLLLTGQSRI